MHLFELRESDHQLLEVRSEAMREHFLGKISHLDQNIFINEKFRNVLTILNKEDPISKLAPNLQG